VASPPRMELHRHYHQMSEKDEDAVVQSVADLIVAYLKRHPGSLVRAASTAATPHPDQPATTAMHTKEIQE